MSGRSTAFVPSIHALRSAADRSENAGFTGGIVPTTGRPPAALIDRIIDTMLLRVKQVSTDRQAKTFQSFVP